MSVTWPEQFLGQRGPASRIYLFPCVKVVINASILITIVANGYTGLGPTPWAACGLTVGGPFLSSPDCVIPF